MIKAVVFDAYGTLIDTKDGSVKATEMILRKNGSALDPVSVYNVWKRYHAGHIGELSSFVREEDIFLMDLKKLYCKFGIRGNAEEDLNIMLDSLYKRDVFPETKMVLSTLKAKYKIYIGSNTDTLPLLSNLIRNELMVDGCYTSEQLQVYKPVKDFFIKILNNINCNADEIIYVGDSQVDDILGAKSLNISTVWVNRKNQILQKDIPKPEYEISRLDEILDFL